MATKVHVYECKIVQGDELVRDQMFAAHRYRNLLCEIERTRRADTDAALAAVCPRLAEVENRLTELDSLIEESANAIRAANAKDRKKKMVPKETRLAMSGMRDKRKLLYAERKTLRADLFGVSERMTDLRKSASELHGKPTESIAWMRRQAWMPECNSLLELFDERILAKPGTKRSIDGQIREELDRLELLESSNQEATRRLQEIDNESGEIRTKARADSGLFWGTYLTVEAAAKKFRSGAPPQFRRWVGDGKLAIQFGGGGMAVEDIGNGTQFSLDPTDTRRKIQKWASPQYLARMRVGRGENEFALLSIFMDRPLPEGATIKWIFLCGRRVATHTTYTLQFVLDDYPEDTDRGFQGSVAVDIGWRRIDNEVRVAYWIGDDGVSGTLELPSDRCGMLPQVDELKSIRDHNFNGLKSLLVEWRKISTKRVESPPDFLRDQIAWAKFELRKHPDRRAERLQSQIAACEMVQQQWSRLELMPDWLAKETETVHAWKSQSRAASLVSRWRENRFAGDEGLFVVLESWRKQDKHLYEWQENLRRKFIAWRRETYRIFARILGRKYKRLVLEKVDWRKFSRLPNAEDDDEMKLARVRKVITAPSILEGCLTQVFAGSVEYVPAKNITATCHVCGELCGETERCKLVYDCVNCHSSFDQDRNACQNLLRAVGCGEKSRGPLAE